MEQLEATGQLPVLGTSPDGSGGGRRRRLLRVLLIAGVAFVVVVALWGVDTNASRGEVGRNVTLGGTAIAGQRMPELEASVADLAARYQTADVVVESADGGFQATAAELGLSVVPDTTTAGAMAVGRT